MINNVTEVEDGITIVALASAVGGGVAVLRISGSQALDIANSIWRGNKSLSYASRRQFLYGKIVDGDEAMAVYMPAPHSYTAEDVVELQCHGGQFTAQDTLKKILNAGAIAAEPGEFTKRAFVNGRLDLTQAEAVLDLINARSESAMNLALRQLDGRLGSSIEALYVSLTELHSEVEVRLDFVEEDLNWTSKVEVMVLLEKAEMEIKKVVSQGRNSAVLREGIKVIIGGPPNAGKSSFLNYIVGYNRAIVTEIEGTTRDTIEEQVQLRDIPVRIMDTAGIRDVDDIVELSGIKRSFQALKEAEFIFWLIDGNKSLESQLPPEVTDVPMIILINKCDLFNVDKLEVGCLEKYSKDIFQISIRENYGLEEAFDRFEKSIWRDGKEENLEYSVNTRHLSLLNLVLGFLDDCKEILENEEWEILAVNLRFALQNLGEVLGRSIQPDILHNIFAKYCIGK